MSREPDLPAAWRTEVGRFREGQPHRVFPLGVHVGVPAGPRAAIEVPWPVPAAYDAGLRFDVVAGVLERWTRQLGGHAFGWLTRPGAPQLHDQDLHWHSAAAHAFGAHGLDLLGFRAVTRAGWLDVVSGESRIWRRLRL